MQGKKGWPANGAVALRGSQWGASWGLNRDRKQGAYLSRQEVLELDRRHQPL